MRIRFLGYTDETEKVEYCTCATTSLQSLIDRGDKFGTVYADPPWPYQNQATRSSTSKNYKTMTLDEISQLPIRNLVEDKAHLHLWTTNAFLFESKTIIEAWGFEYKSCLVWIKPQMGIGNYWRVSHEFLLLGVRGGHKFQSHAEKSWLCEKRIGHSVKPERFRKVIEKVSTGPFLELFARRIAKGWTTWGDEIDRTSFCEVI